MKLTIGWTRSDMANGYSSFDGYRPGASQHVIELEISVDDRMRLRGDLAICEAAFTALNAPGLQPRDGLAYQIEQAVRATGYRGEGAHYSLSVGDTVTVDGRMYACDASGWSVVR